MTFQLSSLHCLFLFTELDADLQHLGQSSVRPGARVVETSDSSADESEASHSRRCVRLKRTFKMKKVWGANEVGQFFVTGATDAAGKPSHFYCRVYRKDVSVLTRGPHEILRHYQGVKHFARDQRLRLETPGWRVLDFEGNPLARPSWSGDESKSFVVLWLCGIVSILLPRISSLTSLEPVIRHCPWLQRCRR